MYVVENKDITWEYDEDSLRVKILEILDKIGNERSQINFDSESARRSIASVIVDELWTKKGQINDMIKTFSYSDENDEFLDMEQNNYFFEGEDCKVLFFSADKNEYLDIVNFNDMDDIKNNFTKE